MKRIKKFFSMLMIVVALLGFSTALQIRATAGGRLFVDPADSVFQSPPMVVGSTFKVNVTIANITGLAGVQFRLSWDPTLLSCQGMQEVLFHTITPFDSWSNIWSLELRYNNTGGYADYAQTWLDISGAVADGYAPANITTTSFPPEGKLALATLTMRVEKAPAFHGNVSCAFGLSNVVAGDVNGYLIPLTTTDGTYTLDARAHDVAVTSVECSKTVIGEGYSETVNVTIADVGNYTETFNVTAYANTTAIGKEEATLTSGNSTSLMFTWNTTGYPYGNYTISAVADTVPNETNTANNNMTGHWVLVTIPGDINGDFTVDIYDAIILAGAFNSKLGDHNWNPNADINGDGIVDARYDAIILSGNFNQHYP